MSILWADNFDNYGLDETNLLDGIYAQISNESGTTAADISLAADPESGATGNVMYFSAEGGTFRFVYPGGGLSTLGIAFRMWMSALPGGPDVAPVFSFRDTANDSQCQLWVNSDGTISFYRGGSKGTQGGATPTGNGGQGTLLGTSTLPVLSASAWHHIEIKPSIHDTTGSLEVRVNGVTVAGLDLSALDTKGTSNATTTQIVLATSIRNGGFSSSMAWYMKDFIVWDTAGTVNNDFLGTVHVYTLTPDSDVAFPWAASTGTTGYNLIDEATPDDADYISADATPPALCEFTLTNLPADIVSVKALVPVVRATKTDGGDGSIQVGVKGTLNDLGADRPITSAFTYWWDVSELSPDTSAAWTPTEVDAAKMTIDRTV